MKLKYILGAGLGLMVVGGLMAGLSYASGAQTSLTWEGGPRIIEMAHETKDFSSDKIDKAVVRADHQNIVIQRGVSFSVETSHDKTQKPKINVEDGTLEISADGQTPTAMLSITDTRSILKITIPRSVTLDELVIEGRNNELRLDEFSSKKINLNTAHTWTSINEVTGEALTVESQMGSLNLTELSMKQVKLEVSDGSIYFNDNEEAIKGEVTLQNSSIEFYDNEDQGLSVTLDGDSYVTKNYEPLSTKTYNRGNKDLKVTGHNSQVNLMNDDEEFPMDDEDYEVYD
ncbi:MULTISPECIES: DUF4097 family beta strand repeat-containing protein [unclassified Enterococcus]|uniref:DUF4097 family beta strand repeat-containing protein n=1 Tax=unclassified Enterococcus TaxID=2608891 RepID=UPI001A9B7FC0|nr:DUF4097 family beta strand repeat-containing protein [Enterococcus sp. DIV1271a]MBO1299323.1 DUF4097 family beta strand repeat protein [Enterococcus sp. DIV1271a]